MEKRIKNWERFNESEQTGKRERNNGWYPVRVGYQKYLIVDTPEELSISKVDPVEISERIANEMDIELMGYQHRYDDNYIDSALFMFPPNFKENELREKYKEVINIYHHPPDGEKMYADFREKYGLKKA